ncbi:MAG: hypothetical protein GXP37_03290 [Chloroflexi bacterium]|nr:hypothetical protein [Chloroflexota bacterium]
MPTSFATTAHLTCPQCRRAFQVDVWLIVDADERADLLQRIGSGTLHDQACPHCDHKGQVDAPLLVYRPQAAPRLIFSPAQNTTAEQDREQGDALLGTLAQNLGDAWQDVWLEQIATVPRSLLPATLSDDPEAALREMKAQAEGELARLQEEYPETFRQLQEAGGEALSAEAEDDDAGESGLPELLQQFITADTWAESQHIIEAYPELLGDEVDALLGTLIEVARAQDDESAEGAFDEHRVLLRRCREVGVEQAFAEKMGAAEALVQAERDGIVPEQLLATMEAATQMPPELKEVLETLAAEGVEVRSPEDLERVLAERPALRAKLEEAARAL